jgi:hypothetical protein
MKTFYQVILVSLTQRRLKRMSSFGTPAYRVNIRRICIYPVVITTIPAIEVNLDNRGT